MGQRHIPIDARHRAAQERRPWAFPRLALRAYLIVCFLLTASAAICPEARAAELPKALPIAQTLNRDWRTDLTLTLRPDATAAASLDVGFGKRIELQPGGADIVRDAGNVLRVEPRRTEFALYAAPEGFGSYVLLKFDNHVNAASYPVPPLGAVDAAHPSDRIGPVRDDDEMHTWLNAFALGQSNLIINIYDAADPAAPPTRIPWHIDPPVTQRKLALSHPIGFVTVEIDTGSSVIAPVWGFASVTTDVGGNAIVLPFRR